MNTLKHILGLEFSQDVEKGWETAFKFVKDAMIGDNFEELVVCELCMRAEPIFVSSNGDNPILRMQEKFMPPFLLQLRNDLKKGREYFKFLKIN